MIVIPEYTRTEIRDELEAMLVLLGNNPTLPQIWAAMDLIWSVNECDNRNISEECLRKYYAHPVWLLNGLFIEQHEESLRYRENFTKFVSDMAPKEVADFGGGFGTLSRMIAKKCPTANVTVIERDPLPEAIEMSRSFKNLRFQPELTGSYDVVIATDVFEHVQDPLSVVEEIAAHLRIHGKFLIGNCFYPVIKCHLPKTFHLRYTFHHLLSMMNLKKLEHIDYAEIFEKVGDVKVTKKVRFSERVSSYTFRIINMYKRLTKQAF